MSGFSQSWLDLREAADHRSRNRRLARLLAEHFAARRPIRVLDLGCGTGSNLRATAPLLGPEQHWRLIDHDEGLLAAAASRLRAWAHTSRLEEETLVLSHGAKRISVEFTRADLARDLMGMLSSDTSLVAASALMDLVSGDFIARLAASLARYGCAFFSSSETSACNCTFPGSRVSSERA